MNNLPPPRPHTHTPVFVHACVMHSWVTLLGDAAGHQSVPRPGQSEQIAQTTDHQHFASDRDACVCARVCVCMIVQCCGVCMCVCVRLSNASD
jgi:hypothetical protein